MRRLLLIPLAGLALLLPAGGSSAHAEHLELAELVAGAERIAEVRVLDERAVLLPDGTIETRYTVATVTPLKGAAAAIEELRMPGGEVAGRGLTVPGLPRFVPGERVVLFEARPTARGWRLPVGLQAGAVRVLPGTAARVAVPGADGRPRAVDRDLYLAEVAAEVARQR